MSYKTHPDSHVLKSQKVDFAIMVSQALCRVANLIPILASGFAAKILVTYSNIKIGGLLASQKKKSGSKSTDTPKQDTWT